MTDDDNLIMLLQSYGYSVVRRLPDGCYIGVMKFLYTTALCVGLDESGYAVRFCYEFEKDACLAFAEYDGMHDPPGPWIVQKGIGGPRMGPGAREPR